MTYKAFSDPKNIDKMTRNIEVCPEQETLEVTLFQNKETPYQNLNHWVKYVSTGNADKLRAFIYWDTKIQDKFLARIEKRLLRDRHYFQNMCQKFLAYYHHFDLFTRQIERRPARYYQNLSEKELIKLFNTFRSHSRVALVGYYIVFDLIDLLLRSVKKELFSQFPKSEKLFEKLCTIGIHSDLVRKSSKKEKQQIADLLGPFRKYPDLHAHILWLRQAMGYRNKESVALNDYYERTTKFFNELKRRLNVSERDFRYLSKEEIVNGLQKKVNVKRIIEERKIKGVTIKQIGRKIKVLTGVKPEDWHEVVSVSKDKEIRGNIAFAGKVVQGKVRIIFNPEFDQIKIGDIMVTPMTTPNFVPLMKKAGAIVTDEGGLLCHASIVARELKKPCIVGTKFATQILKDGDLVEVDANKGIVKILGKT